MDVLHRIPAVTHEFSQIVFIIRLRDINQMMLHSFAGRKRVFPDVLSAPDVESAIKLA